MAGRRWLLTVSALMALAAPAALNGQQQSDAPTPAPDEASIRALASLQVELNIARDEYNTAIAAVHEDEARQEARDELKNRRAEILAAHHSTELDYQKRIYAVSTDATARALFDRFVKEAAEATAPASPAPPLGRALGRCMNARTASRPAGVRFLDIPPLVA